MKIIQWKRENLYIYRKIDNLRLGLNSSCLLTWPTPMPIYGQKNKAFTKGLVWHTNMATVSLVFNTNMAVETPYKTLYSADPRPQMIPKLDHKWSRTAEDPRCGPQLIPREVVNGMESGFPDFFFFHFSFLYLPVFIN